MCKAISLKRRIADACAEDLVFSWSFASQVSRGVMPRRGWTAIATPSGWFEVLRGPRPPSVKWPVATKGQGTKGQGKGKGNLKPVSAVKAPQKVQGNSKVARLEAALQALGQEQSSARSALEEALKTAKEAVPKPMHSRLPPNPDVAMADARERVSRLEAAISSLGDNDSATAGLKEALRQARLMAQVRPVEDRIAGTKMFIERSKKRIITLQEAVVKAQAAVVEAQAKLVAEEEALRDGEQRLVTLDREASCLPQQPPPTVPADFAQELAQLRASVQELRRERDDLRAEMSKRGDKRSRGRSRSLANPSSDLITGDFSLQRVPVVNRGSCRASSVMETLIDNADSVVRSNHRFNPM